MLLVCLSFEIKMIKPIPQLVSIFKCFLARLPCPWETSGGFFYRLICYALLKILTGKREMALVQEDIDLIQEMIAKAFVERPESIR
jgi:hypothetical protein